MKSIRTLAAAAIMTLGASAWAGTTTGQDASEQRFAYADPVASAWAPATVIPAMPIESRSMLPPIRREIGMQSVPLQPANHAEVRNVLANEVGSSALDGPGFPPRRQTAPLIVPLPSAAAAGLMMLGLFGFVLAWRRVRTAIMNSNR